MYQIANVYLMLLAGSLFNALNDAIANPASIIFLIGKALPSVSIFFINLLLTQLLSGFPGLLLRIGPLIVYKLYRGIFGEKALTRRILVEVQYLYFSSLIKYVELFVTLFVNNKHFLYAP